MSEEKAMVLIIDDSEENLEIISTKLSHQGYRVLTAPDGESGLDLAGEKSPDIIICDIMLPGMDGWDFLSKLQKDDGIKNIPVILMTAYTTIQFHSEKEQAIKKGAVDYLKKPFDLNDLVDLVELHAGNPKGDAN